MSTEIIRFELSEFKDKVIDQALDCINARMTKVAADIAIKETERREKMVMLAMSKHYLQLRKVADELFDSARHPRSGRKRLKNAMDAYDHERRLTVDVEAIPLEAYFR